jgi:hypothetical protein
MTGFIEDLDKMSQDSLIQLFFDWFDYYGQFPSEDALKKVWAIRERIKIYTSTGVKDLK